MEIILLVRVKLEKSFKCVCVCVCVCVYTHTHMCMCSVGSVESVCGPMDVAFQTPLSIGFSRREYCSSRGSPDPWIKPMSGVCLGHCRWILYH